jgi:hypothetical protein
MSFLWRALLSLSLIDEEPLSGADSAIGQESVCRRNISDGWLGNLREYLAHLV